MARAAEPGRAGRRPCYRGVGSQQIDGSAIPKLASETLAAQSGGHIDAVSGATYTSDGCIRSLQSALDKARS